MMGRHVKAKFNTINSFSYRPDEIMKYGKDIKLDNQKLQRIKKIEM